MSKRKAIISLILAPSSLVYRSMLYDYPLLKNKLLNQNTKTQQILVIEQENARRLELEKRSRNRSTETVTVQLETIDLER